MNKSGVCSLLLISAAFSLSCGSGRHLQSITIQEAINGTQLQFSATGTFSAPPTTVSPLPVFWSSAPPPPQYTLTARPYVYNCNHLTPVAAGPLIAFAPSDPNAASSGSIKSTRMVSGSAKITCP